MTSMNSESKSEGKSFDKLLHLQRQLTVLVLALVAFIAFLQIGGFFCRYH